MWTIETAGCEDCDREFDLITDGREAYVVSVDRDWETTEVEVDGLLMTTTCPAPTRTPGYPEESCGGHLRWTGEGQSLREDEGFLITFAKPIER